MTYIIVFQLMKLIGELASAVCIVDPVGKCFGKDGVLYLFYKADYILDANKHSTFQYIPVLSSIQYQVLCLMIIGSRLFKISPLAMQLLILKSLEEHK